MDMCLARKGGGTCLWAARASVMLAHALAALTNHMCSIGCPMSWQCIADQAGDRA